MVPPAAAATLTIVSPAGSCAAARSLVGTSAGAATAVLVAVHLVAVLLLVFGHRLPVPRPRNGDLHFPFPTNGLFER